jgi:hypothetical protein
MHPFAPLYAYQSSTEDSLAEIKAKIKANGKALNTKKLKQIKRIKTADSLVFYGADNKETHILFVHNSNYAKGLFVQYTFNESGVIGIGVLKRPVMRGENNKKSHYYFENGKLIYSRDRHKADDIAFLLIEAERFRQQGMLILKSLRSNPIPKI